jgi:hypothetical protein
LGMLCVYPIKSLLSVFCSMCYITHNLKKA